MEDIIKFYRSLKKETMTVDEINKAFPVGALVEFKFDLNSKSICLGKVAETTTDQNVRIRESTFGKIFHRPYKFVKVYGIRYDDEKNWGKFLKIR